LRVGSSGIGRSAAAEAGQLQLNVFEPVITFNLFTAMVMLSRASRTFAEKCVDGIELNEQHCREQVLSNIGLVTALNPYIGYEKSSYVAKTALHTGGSVYDIVLKEGFLSKEELDRIIAPENMVYPKK